MSNGIYEAVVAQGIEHDHHESDLYILATPEATALVKGYQFACNVTQFRHQVDGLIWYDVPFAYRPYWDAKAHEG